MSEQEKVFADGFLFKTKENDPEWVIGHLSLKADEAIAFIKANTKPSGWLNLDIKVGKSGKEYVELDTWEPKPQGEGNAPAAAAPAARAKVGAPVQAPAPAPTAEEDLPF